MGFSQPKTPVEPTIRRCRFCGKAIHYVIGSHDHTLKTVGWCHIAPGDWVTCSGKGPPMPVEKP